MGECLREPRDDECFIERREGAEVFGVTPLGETVPSAARRCDADAHCTNSSMSDAPRTLATWLLWCHDSIATERGVTEAGCSQSMPCRSSRVWWRVWEVGCLVWGQQMMSSGPSGVRAALPATAVISSVLRVLV